MSLRSGIGTVVVFMCVLHTVASTLTCGAGYTKGEGGSCTVCLAGTYKAETVLHI